MDFAERLARALALAGKHPSDLAGVLCSPSGKIGVSKQAVHAALRRETKSFTAENTMRAAKYLAVDAWWLATGLGLPRPDPPAATTAQEPVARFGETSQQISDSEWQMLRDLRIVPEDDRRRIMGEVSAEAERVREIVRDYMQRFTNGTAK